MTSSAQIKLIYLIRSFPKIMPTIALQYTPMHRYIIMYIYIYIPVWDIVLKNPVYQITGTEYILCTIDNEIMHRYRYYFLCRIFLV